MENRLTAWGAGVRGRGIEQKKGKKEKELIDMGNRQCVDFREEGFRWR